MRRRGTIGMVVGALVGALGLAGTGLAQAGPGALYQVTAVETPVVARDSGVQRFEEWNGRVYFSIGGYGITPRLWAHDPVTDTLTECMGLEGWSSLQILGTTARGVMLFCTRPGVGTVLVRWGGPGDVEEAAVVAGVDQSLSYVLGAEVGDRIFFRSDDQSLWVSDGTAVGTSRVRRFEGWVGPYGFTPAGGQLIFSTKGALWVSDGTDAGTRVLLSDGQPGLDSLGAGEIEPGVVIVALGRGLHRFEAATGTLTSVTQEAVVSAPILVGERVVYEVEGVGVRAWTTGTSATTILETGWDQVELGRAGGVAVVALEGTRRGVWTTDGTLAGTARVGDVPEAWNLSSVRSDGMAAWILGVKDERRVMIRSDGTSEGTFEAQQGVVGEYPTVALGVLYTSDRLDSSASDRLGIEPYVTDSAGRGRLVGDFAPASHEGLFLSRDSLVVNRDLWFPRSDGGFVAINGVPGELRLVVEPMPEQHLLGSDGVGGVLGIIESWGDNGRLRRIVRWTEAGDPGELLGTFEVEFSSFQPESPFVGAGVCLITDGEIAYISDGTPEGTSLAFNDDDGAYRSSWNTSAAWTGSWFAVNRQRQFERELWRVDRDGRSRFVATYEATYPRSVEVFGGRAWRTRGDLGDATGTWDSCDGEGGFVEVRGGLPLSWRYLGAVAGRWVFAELDQSSGLTIAMWTANEGDVTLGSMARLTAVAGLSNAIGIVGARVIVERGYGHRAAYSFDVVTGRAEMLPGGYGDVRVLRAGERDLVVIAEWTPTSERYWVSDGTAAGTRAVPGMPLGRSFAMAATAGRLFVAGDVPGLGQQMFAANLCAADFDGDGMVSAEDYAGFVAAFESDDPRGDANGDGFVDWFDYVAFVEGFEVGC
jgi:hypothetical protein